ncbi:MAG: TonB-dependent receptor plug domain-containing protein, partial [Candidatus Aureabacteria bacterium]|nr:TonB-dependent receptor plug domain-containing protein [Candidatus Auribacterota bacterium]
MFRCLMKTGLICFSWLYMAVFPLLCQEETGSADYEGEGLSFWLAAPEDYLKQKKSAPYHVARMKKSGEDTPFDVTVITDQDMEVLPVRNASEALNLLSSVTMSYGGEFIQACIPTVLGSDLTHTKVVMDGIELNTQLDGTADLSAYGFDQVQKFEIVTGPLSSLWGSSLGGVIYMKTKNPSVEPSLTVRSSYGSHETLRSSLDASFHLGKVGCLFIPQYTETDGYMDGGRSKRTSTFFKGQYEMKEISMELIAGYSDFDIGEYEQKRFFIRTELDGHDFYSGLKINSDALFSNQDLAGSL